MTFLQADIYGDSEDLLGKWFAANPEKRNNIFVATKFGYKGNSIDSSPEYAREAIEKSLKRLGLTYVDLYYVHRLDQVTPIEKTIEALVELKKAGKINYIGLSECSSSSLRRAHAIHPISCVQMAYSPICVDIELPEYGLLAAARELGVATVPYNPLGNGLLTGSIRKKEDYTKEGDGRGFLPWFSDENFPKNLAIVDKIGQIAKGKGVTMAQLTLAWILSQGEDFFPIPGTTNVKRLAENLASIDIVLTTEEERLIRQLASGVAGKRFPDALLASCFADTPALSS
jgi:aryl-alcohol dehydrogenase-like predicted oxidoreductase